MKNNFPLVQVDFVIRVDASTVMRPKEEGGMMIAQGGEAPRAILRGDLNCGLSAFCSSPKQMPSPQNIRRLVLTAAVTSITIAGSLYGAGIKTTEEVAEVSHDLHRRNWRATQEILTS